MLSHWSPHSRFPPHHLDVGISSTQDTAILSASSDGQWRQLVLIVTFARTRTPLQLTSTLDYKYKSAIQFIHIITFTAVHRDTCRCNSITEQITFIGKKFPSKPKHLVFVRDEIPLEEIPLFIYVLPQCNIPFLGFGIQKNCSRIYWVYF